MVIPFTQYLRPDGRKTKVEFVLTEKEKDLYDKAHQIIADGYRFECEMLRDEHTCSFTIHDPRIGEDVGIQLAPNDASVVPAIRKLIENFRGRDNLADVATD